MTDMTTGATAIVDRYIAMWNETDAARRVALVARTWTEDASFIDPDHSVRGHAAIDTMVAAVQAEYAGYRFRRASEVDAHSGGLRFTWRLYNPDGVAVASGTDFGVLDEPAGERLAQIRSFLGEPAPLPEVTQ